MVCVVSYYLCDRSQFQQCIQAVRRLCFAHLQDFLRSVSPLWVTDRDSFRTKRLMEVLDNPVRRTLLKHCLCYERYVWGNIFVPFQHDPWKEAFNLQKMFVRLRRTQIRYYMCAFILHSFYMMFLIFETLLSKLEMHTSYMCLNFIYTINIQNKNK